MVARLRNGRSVNKKSIPRRGKKRFVFLFAAFVLVIGSIHPPVHYIPGIVFQGVELLDCEERSVYCLLPIFT